MSKVQISWVISEEDIRTEVVAAGALSATSGGAPSVPSNRVRVRVQMLSGAAYVIAGVAPVASAGAGRRIKAGDPAVEWDLASGSKVAVLAVSANVSQDVAAVGPSPSFEPVPGQPFNIGLGPAAFVATAGPQKSLDGGATWRDVTYVDGSPITWSAPMLTDFTEGQAGVLWRVNVSAFTSGPVHVEISQ